jgi:malonyl CoA-acyl carrier protein transacylase
LAKIIFPVVTFPSGIFRKIDPNKAALSGFSIGEIVTGGVNQLSELLALLRFVEKINTYTST